MSQQSSYTDELTVVLRAGRKHAYAQVRQNSIMDERDEQEILILVEEF